MVLTRPGRAEGRSAWRRNGRKMAQRRRGRATQLGILENPAPFNVAHGPGRNGHGRGSTVVPSPVAVVAGKERSGDVWEREFGYRGEREIGRETEKLRQKNYKILYIISVIINLY